MTSKEHYYVMHLIERVWIEVDHDEDNFLTLDIDKITSKLNEEMKDLQKTIKEGI